MNSREVLRDMREYLGIGAFVTKTQLSKYLKTGRHELGGIEKYIDGISYMPDGRGKNYFASDVAKRIVELSVRGSGGKI